jgi:hypothetical protein
MYRPTGAWLLPHPPHPRLVRVDEPRGCTSGKTNGARSIRTSVRPRRGWRRLGWAIRRVRARWQRPRTPPAILVATARDCRGGAADPGSAAELSRNGDRVRATWLGFVGKKQRIVVILVPCVVGGVWTSRFGVGPPTPGRSRPAFRLSEAAHGAKEGTNPIESLAPDTVLFQIARLPGIAQGVKHPSVQSLGRGPAGSDAGQKGSSSVLTAPWPDSRRSCVQTTSHTHVH